MPANVETMAYAGQKPWHGIGHEITEEADKYDWITFKKHAGLDWNVDVYPAKFGPDNKESNSCNIFVRSDNGMELGHAGKKTLPLQNDKAFEFFSPFLQEKLCELHTAGSLDEGRKVWVLAKITSGGDTVEIVKGDSVEKFLLLSNAHDGSLAVRVGFTPIRVVCANTLRMAHGADASKLVRIRHTKSMHNNLENIRETINLINQEFEATAEQYRLLANKGINQADLQKYIKMVFRKDEEEDTSTRFDNILSRICELNEIGEGSDIPGVRGTLWGAYNSVTNYLSHEKGRTVENRLANNWFGIDTKINDRALEMALAMAI